MMLLLICPKCKNKMKYMTKERILTGKRKVCVYCGKSFKIGEHVLKRIDE